MQTAAIAVVGAAAAKLLYDQVHATDQAQQQGSPDRTLTKDGSAAKPKQAATKKTKKKKSLQFREPTRREICKCGTELLDDSKFCRKCGSARIKIVKPSDAHEDLRKCHDVGHVSEKVKQMYNALKQQDGETISAHFFLEIMECSGLHKDDQRLKVMHEFLEKEGLSKEADIQLSLDKFHEAVSSCGVLVGSAMDGTLRVPDFEGLSEIIDQVYSEVEPNEGGENAGYIETLKNVDSDQFAISFCSIDGQRHNIGDFDTQFCIQSCVKPINYLIGLKEFGPAYVHDAIGKEPSGVKFNQMVLKDRENDENGNKRASIPHNPMINAGAIMACSMVYPHSKDRQVRLESTLEVWKQLSGGSNAPIGFCEETYQAESATADRNWCLGYMMKESQAFPACFKVFDDDEEEDALKETLELYFQTCSILSTCDAMGIMSATLANGGFCPLTGEKVFEPEHVRSVLPLMLTCGMYDYSGQWAWDVGIPAKSGVGGCVFMVVPNVGGFAMWSPRLDSVGNSVRAVDVATKLVDKIKIHNFEVFSGLHVTKMDLEAKKYSSGEHEKGKVLTAANEGDVAELLTLKNQGTDIFCADYDKRTALHLAAAEGHDEVVKFLIKHSNGNSAVLSAEDRWEGTPLGDAERGMGRYPKSPGYKECCKLLRETKVAKSDSRGALEKTKDMSLVHAEDTAGIVLSAAAAGDIKTLVHLASTGANLFCCDYDARTALHLAASEGQIDTVKYLCAQMAHAPQVIQSAMFQSSCADLSNLANNVETAKAQAKLSLLEAQDRFCGTPLDDAKREHHDECAHVLESARNSIKTDMLQIGEMGTPRNNAPVP